MTAKVDTLTITVRDFEDEGRVGTVTLTIAVEPGGVEGFSRELLDAADRFVRDAVKAKLADYESVLKDHNRYRPIMVRRKRPPAEKK